MDLTQSLFALIPSFLASLALYRVFDLRQRVEVERRRALQAEERFEELAASQVMLHEGVRLALQRLDRDDLGSY